MTMEMELFRQYVESVAAQRKEDRAEAARQRAEDRAELDRRFHGLESSVQAIQTTLTNQKSTIAGYGAGTGGVTAGVVLLGQWIWSQIQGK